MRNFDEAAGKVRELLFNGSLRPGDRLPAERDLCVMLGVSRPVLREALRALEAGGLLEMRAGRYGGTFITGGKGSVVSNALSDLLRLGTMSISELFEARQWIQGALVRVACERLSNAEIDALEANIIAAERAHEEGDAEERMRLNFEFHAMLASGTGNPVATMVVRGLSEAWRALISEVGSDLVAGSVAFKKALIKALRERDEDAAAHAMAKILRTSEAMYKKLAIQRAGLLLESAVIKKSPPRKSPPGKSAPKKTPAVPRGTATRAPR